MLAHAAYGKSRVRLVQVSRRPHRHDIRDLTVAIRFEGRYDAAYTAGDNSNVLPTDTMKNTVYALAAREPIGDPERLGVTLAGHFLDRNPDLLRTEIDLTEHPWGHLPRGDREHGHAFIRSGAETRTAAVHADRREIVVKAGLADVVILKSAHSAFAGFPRDEYTTLAETRDRILATSLTATWRYRHRDIEFGSTWQRVRQILLDAFAEHRSESVQHTLHAMGQAVLDSVRDVGEIHLAMPNKHHLPVDLRPFGLDNRHEMFVPTDEPYGFIEATLTQP